MPLTIDFTDAELAAVAALIRRAIEEDHFPNAPAPRPAPLGAAKLDPAAAASLTWPLTAKSAKPAVP